MRIIRNLSGNAKLLALTSVFTLSFLLFGAAVFYTLDKQAQDGPNVAQLIDDEQFLAEILPPPAFAIESSQAADKMREVASAEEIAQIETELSRLREEYNTSINKWTENLQDPKLQRDLLVRSHKAAQRFHDIVESGLLRNRSRAGLQKLKIAMDLEMVFRSQYLHEQDTTGTGSRNDARCKSVRAFVVGAY